MTAAQPEHDRPFCPFALLHLSIVISARYIESPFEIMTSVICCWELMSRNVSAFGSGLNPEGGLEKMQATFVDLLAPKKTPILI